MGQRREFHCTGCAGGCYRKAQKKFGLKHIGALEFAQYGKFSLAQEGSQVLKVPKSTWLNCFI